MRRVAGLSLIRRQASKPSSLRHQDVHQDDVGLLLSDGVESFLAVVRNPQAIAVAAEEARHEPAVGLEIIDDEDAAGDGLTATRRCSATDSDVFRATDLLIGNRCQVQSGADG